MAPNARSTIRTIRSGVTDGDAATWLVFAGVVLFVVPEPITSVLGALVVLAGIAVWVAGALF